MSEPNTIKKNPVISTPTPPTGPIVRRARIVVNRRGPKEKLNDRLQVIICMNVRLGLTYEKSAVLAGISSDAFLNWRKKGVEDYDAGNNTKYSRLIRALKEAESAGERTMIAVVEGAARGGAERIETKTIYKGNRIAEYHKVVKKDKPAWQAGAWMLERKHRANWARTPSALDSTPDGGNFEINIIEDTED